MSYKNLKNYDDAKEEINNLRNARYTWHFYVNFDLEYRMNKFMRENSLNRTEALNFILNKFFSEYEKNKK